MAPETEPDKEPQGGVEPTTTGSSGAQVPEQADETSIVPSGDFSVPAIRMGPSGLTETLEDQTLSANRLGRRFATALAREYQQRVARLEAEVSEARAEAKKERELRQESNLRETDLRASLRATKDTLAGKDWIKALGLICLGAGIDGFASGSWPPSKIAVVLAIVGVAALFGASRLPKPEVPK